MKLGPLLLVALLLAGVAPAQKLRDKSQPFNAPVQCPYCHGDAEKMKAVGVVSHGGFAFGKEPDTKGADAGLTPSRIIWTETERFKLGFGLGRIKVTQKEKEKIRAECARLREFLPDVPEKPRTMDPWLRSHLYAQRLQDVWDEMIDILGVIEEDFPDGTKPWDTTGKYMGQGPHLGQKGQYEVLIVPSEGASRAYLKQYYGLLTKLTQRWNLTDLDVLQLVVHIQQGGLKTDEALHGHVAFNVVHQLLDGYKHYSYETPVWIHEGLAHWVERRINPRFNTFDSSEGAVAEMTRKHKWQPPTRKLVTQGKAPRMAQLVGMKSYAELELEHHYTTWSMVDFLMTEHPDFLGTLLDAIKGLYNDKFIDDGTGMWDVHRRTFVDDLGMNYQQFDAAWREWVLATYSVQ
ncbi:MAG: hypothetical protein GY711_21820 [bacterium]|nr:hypothetical protein [bacterium]